MKNIVVFAIFLNLISSFAQASNNIIFCELVEVIHWIHIYNQRVCVMELGTTIDADDSIIEQTDDSISALWINGGTNIFYLPVKVSVTYPNLVGYAANSCSITTISKKNFEGLNKVKALWLTNNQIEKIPSNTFDDLISLEFLDLDRNQIKFMSGDLFKYLNNLEKVYLSENKCINRNFEDRDSLQGLVEEVTKLCGSNESEEIYEASLEPAELRAAQVLPVTREDIDKLISIQLVHQSYIQTLVERNTLQETRISNLESKIEKLEAIIEELQKNQREITSDDRDKLETEIKTLRDENFKKLEEIATLEEQLKETERSYRRH